MKLMIFTEGTIIMHKNGMGQNRERRVRQVKDADPTIHDYGSYVPIGEADKKIACWKNQGAEIFYLTSRRKQEEIKDVERVLRRFGFPDGELVYRRENEEYGDVVERIKPGVIIEDDCESIGGTDKMTVTNVNPLLKEKIISVPVREFGGIDHLEDGIYAFSRMRSGLPGKRGGMC